MPIDQNWSDFDQDCSYTFSGLHDGPDHVASETQTPSYSSSDTFVPTDDQRAFIEKWGHMDQMVHGEFVRDLIAAFVENDKS